MRLVDCDVVRIAFSIYERGRRSYESGCYGVGLHSFDWAPFPGEDRGMRVENVGSCDYCYS